jgi:hypothetical protein
MKRILLMVGATTLLVAPFRAQTQNAQTQNDMTIPEFRQVLVDLGSYLDAHRGTNLSSQFEAIPDDVLKKLYPAVANPRQLQSSVATLKQHDAAHRAQPTNLASTPQVVYTSCAPDSIIRNSPGAPCTPAYPDPTNGSWEAMVNPLITFGAFSPTDYPDVSMQGCGLTVETNLQQVTVGLIGSVTVAGYGCEGLGAIPVGGTVAEGVCEAAVALVAVAGEVSQGLYSDCIEQDGLVNAAEIDAGFHNTVTIYDALGTDFTSLNTAMSTDFTSLNIALSTDFTNLNTALGSDFTNLTTTVNSDSTTTDALITTDFMALTTQISQGTALLQAYLKQIMKLELTPDGQKKIDPPILTCTGANCPNVLAACPAAGCSWNNAGPLP